MKVGPREKDASNMLQSIGFENFDQLVRSTVPADILQHGEMDLQPAMSESEALQAIRYVTYFTQLVVLKWNGIHHPERRNCNRSRRQLL